MSIFFFLFSIIVFVQSSPVVEHPLARYWALTCSDQLGVPYEKCRSYIKSCNPNCGNADACTKCVLALGQVCAQCLTDLASFPTLPITVNDQANTVLTDLDNQCTQLNQELCIFACHLRAPVGGYLDGSCMSFPNQPRTRCVCDGIIQGGGTTPAPITINPFPGFLTDVLGVNLVNLIGFPSNTQWSLLYQGARDGFSSIAFHSKCDGSAKTLTIVKSVIGGYIFGGYTAQTWDSSNTYKNDASAFIYSLTNRNNIAYKFPIKSGSTNAIYCQTASGPKFGGPNNFDLAISHESNTNAVSFSELGSNYNIGQLPATELGTFLGGAFQFAVSDIAVYRML
jgi:hypothetical protein